MFARARRQFTDAFKAEAVNLVSESGYKIAQVARAVDQTDNALLNWVERAQSQSGTVLDLSSAERHELLQLRQENRVLRMERER